MLIINFNGIQNTKNEVKNMHKHKLLISLLTATAAIAAPVRVAASMTNGAFVSAAANRPSASTSRPSASVFTISTVTPFL